jgi:hypothetical protein
MINLLDRISLAPGRQDSSPRCDSRKATSSRLSRPERRRVIEDAATELLARRGYAVTTVDEIVAPPESASRCSTGISSQSRSWTPALLERHRDELIGAPLEVSDRQAPDWRGQVVAMLEVARSISPPLPSGGWSTPRSRAGCRFGCSCGWTRV